MPHLFSRELRHNCRPSFFVSSKIEAALFIFTSRPFARNRFLLFVAQYVKSYSFDPITRVVYCCYYLASIDRDGLKLLSKRRSSIRWYVAKCGGAKMTGHVLKLFRFGFIGTRLLLREWRVKIGIDLIAHKDVCLGLNSFAKKSLFL